MKKPIQFLGTGGAFEPEFGNSSALIDIDGQTILLDCGFTVYPKLKLYGLTDKIDYVLISHLHNDHVGSLSTFIYHYNIAYDFGRLKILYASDALRNDIEGFLRYSIPALDHYVEFVPLSLFPQIKALDTFGLHVPGFSTFGFEMVIENQRYIYSGDLGDANYIATNCSPTATDIIFHDTCFYPQVKAHAYYKDLQNTLKGCRVYGYHLDPTMKPADCSLNLVAESKEWLFKKE